MIPIYVEDPITWEKTIVPYKVVRYCSDLTKVNPFDENNNFIEQLRLVDCYWMNMGYYDVIPAFD